VDLGLRDKVALVAASSRGLGRAVAEDLATEGAHLILCARGAGELNKTAADLRARGAQVEAIVADLSTEEGVQSVVSAGLQRFGRIDVLVTNAGGPPSGPFETHDMNAWRSAVRVNLESVIYLTRAVLPGMKERRWGRIVNITSIAVKQPVDGLILSNSVRSAVTGLARTLANEVAPFGITVNNVLPGYTRTERLVDLAAAIAKREGIATADAEKRWISEIPMGRLGEPPEFAALVVFLCSERASFITGTSITVDGGWVKSLL
jgi:3-oxoacyl-[acyl-carrier protein] reductase